MFFPPLNYIGNLVCQMAHFCLLRQCCDLRIFLKLHLRVLTFHQAPLYLPVDAVRVMLSHIFLHLRVGALPTRNRCSFAYITRIVASRCVHISRLHCTIPLRHGRLCQIFVPSREISCFIQQSRWWFWHLSIQRALVMHRRAWWLDICTIALVIIGLWQARVFHLKDRFLVQLIQQQFGQWQSQV